MKTRFLLLIIAIAPFCKAQQKYIQTQTGKIIDAETFEKERKDQVATFKKGMPADKYFDIIYEYDAPRKSHDSIIYKVKSMAMSSFPPEINYKNVFSKENLLGKTFPVKSLETLDGKGLNLDQLKGKPSVINFWYTGCGPCIKEMPLLNEIQKDYGDKVNFIAITFDQAERVKQFLDKHSFNYRHAVNAKDFMNDIKFHQFPKTFYLDKNGIVVKIEDVLTHEQKPEAKNTINQLL